MDDVEAIAEVVMFIRQKYIAPFKIQCYVFNMVDCIS